MFSADLSGRAPLRAPEHPFSDKARLHVRARRHLHPRRQGAQPQERLARHPEEEAGGVHRRLGLRQELARVRHALRRGPAPLRREPLRLRPAVPRADGEAASTTRIRGLSPTISIEQKAASNNPRSTVGTITEVHDYLRVLYAAHRRAALPQLRPQGGQAERAADRRRDPASCRAGTKLLLLAPLVAEPQGRAQGAARRARRSAASPARASTARSASSRSASSSTRSPSTTSSWSSTGWCSSRTSRARLTDSVETALREGKGMLDRHRRARARRAADRVMSELNACPRAACPSAS